MNKLIYKEKEYTEDDLSQDQQKFNESLELPDDFVDYSYKEFSIVHDIGYSIAAQMLEELYYLIASARHALINSYQKFFEKDIISSNNQPLANLWIRTEHLKNSIVWYNSCEDYVYQMLWFGYELHQNNMNDPNWYKEELGNCTFKKLKVKLNQHKSQDAKNLLILLDSYRDNSDVKYLREELANNLKHRASLRFEGLERGRSLGFKKKDKLGNIAFDSNWINPTVVDIDDTIDVVQKVHLKLVSHVREIIKFMNLFDVFELDKNGDVILTQIKSKARYKRIVF